MTKKLVFPVRLHQLDRVEVIRLPRPMGGSAKIFLRETAKKISEYHLAIECEIAGRSDSGETIPINSVGRWLFGVPGYMGHIRVTNWEGVDCKVEWPAQAPDVIHQLISSIKQAIEGIETIEEPKSVLEQAMRLIQEKKPQASIQKKAAFVNSVQYLVTGWSGGYGGPSVREHAASYLYGGRRFGFDEAVQLLLADDGPIFGPITKLHRECWLNESCFDDDPSDVEQLDS